MPTTLKQLYWDINRLAKAGKERRAFAAQCALVSELLRQESTPKTSPAEEAFDLLQSTYSGPGEYGYGFTENWLRGSERSRQLVRAVPGLGSGSRTLEVACGDGMTSVVLATLGVQVETTDLQDWRDARAQHLAFTACDLGKADSFPAGPFDLVFSYNAFEHFPDPARALSLMVHATKPGGWLFFEFGPLYAGPWGLHAYRMLRMPYPQFLFSEEFWRSKIQAMGVTDLGQSLDDLQPLNKWTFAQFDALWAASGCEILSKQNYTVHDHLDIVLRYPESFQGRGLSLAELTTQGVCVLLRKREA
jgi:SAM-dependent methyltransferase